MEEQERLEWSYREEEIKAIQEERMELLRKMLQQREVDYQAINNKRIEHIWLVCVWYIIIITLLCLLTSFQFTYCLHVVQKHNNYIMKVNYIIKFCFFCFASNNCMFSIMYIYM